MPKSVQPENLVGRTIQSAELIPAEYGRTYSRYLCLVFMDGGKLLMGIDTLDCWNPNPNIEDMKKAPHFFTADDIAAKVLAEERRRRQRLQDVEQQEREQLERLQRKYQQA